MQQFTHLLDLLVVSMIATAFLVAPVRGHSELGLVLHFLGAYLHFQ